ncbi:MAG: AAA family ATPase [Fibrobacter sp.]|nr:AAA family ATPase [Fibrobacter sp.]
MTMNSYFYSSVEDSFGEKEMFQELESWSKSQKKNVYIVNRPLGVAKYEYSYSNAFMVLIPGYKVLFVDCADDDSEEFDEYVEDVIDDLGAISDKYDHKDILGRSRKWKDRLFVCMKNHEFTDINSLLDFTMAGNEEDARHAEILMSLITGSYNEAERIGKNVPTNLLDKVKQKIILFDGDQTRFIYEKTPDELIRIQGMSGTGKTELLLHKIKDLYLKYDSDIILFTCHNKILAHELKERLPNFFNYMKVEKQIDPNKIMCMHSWGSAGDNGTYRYICQRYGLPFYSLRSNMTFDQICTQAAEILEKKKTQDGWEFAFDWTFVDESQDFGEGFVRLCRCVTKNKVYLAGDIFQSIFSEIPRDIHPNYLLSKCYRTDPKTLMFAHGLGMGLFESKRYQWLDEKQWMNCGYEVSKSQDNTITLTREPLRRFEDIDSGYSSVKLIANLNGTSILDRVILEIKRIKDENKDSIKPHDICVIFLDDGDVTYDRIAVLERMILENFSWVSNKAYETKEKRKNEIMLSNRNNVKGLEFPFVICCTFSLGVGLRYRNALYTMMTRSFLQSVLIVENLPEKTAENLQKHLMEILAEGKMTVEIPNENEIKQIQINIDSQENRRSLMDVIDRTIDKHSIPKTYKKDIKKQVYDSVDEESFDPTEVEGLILALYKIQKRSCKCK